MPYPQNQNVSPSGRKSPTPPEFTTLLAATFVFVHRLLPRLSTAQRFPGMLLVLAGVAGLAGAQAAAVVDQKSGAAVTPTGKPLLQVTMTGGGSADVTVNVKGAVEMWTDLSGNEHHGLPCIGAPILATNQINGKPAVQFRTAAGQCALNCDGPFFAESQYVVVRSPSAMAQMVAPLVEHYNYGKKHEQPITPPDQQKAYYSSTGKDESCWRGEGNHLCDRPELGLEQFAHG